MKQITEDGVQFNIIEPLSAKEAEELMKTVVELQGELTANENIAEAILPCATKLGDAAFAFCKNLKEVKFSPDIREIGSDAFCECEQLHDVWFPMTDRNARVFIADDAFQGCSNVCFHVFGLELENGGNADVEEYARRHAIRLVGMM